MMLLARRLIRTPTRCGLVEWITLQVAALLATTATLLFDWGNEMFVTYNETTKRVYSAAEQHEPHVPEGHVTVEVELSFADLKVHPSFCRFENGQFVHDPAIQAEFEPTYAMKRAAEYPPVTEQLDAMYKGGEAAAAMAATIQAIKAKYPKPESK